MVLKKERITVKRMKRIAILPHVRLAETRNGKVRPKWLAILLVSLVHFAVMLLVIVAMDVLLGNGIRFSGTLFATPLIVTAFIMEERTYRNIEQCERMESPNTNLDHISGSVGGGVKTVQNGRFKNRFVFRGIHAGSMRSFMR